MIYLARAKKRIAPLKEISEKEGMPFDYLEKIFSQLEKSGLVKAKKGSRGGYFIGKNPSQIKIGKIIRSLEGETFLVKCLESCCPREKKCLSKSVWKKLQKSLDTALDSITLANLIK